MKFGKGIFGVYAPVMLAAVMIMTVAPTCLMPSCGDLGGNAATACAQPQSQFKSACELDSAPSSTQAPCHSGECDDSAMSHGAPDAVVVQTAELPSPIAVAVSQAPAVSAVALCGYIDAIKQLPDTHPPDPLGVRLSV